MATPVLVAAADNAPERGATELRRVGADARVRRIPDSERSRSCDLIAEPPAIGRIRHRSPIGSKGSRRSRLRRRRSSPPDLGVVVMLSLPSSVRVFLARESVDFRRAFDGLHAIVRDSFHDDPFSGHFFVFLNRRRDRVKILAWDRNGFWLFAKRLERGTFEFASLASATGSRIEITRAQFFMLLEGIDTKSVKLRKHFASNLRPNERDVGAEDLIPDSQSRLRGFARGESCAP